MAETKIILGLDAKPLKAGLDGARRDVERFGQGANRTINQIGKQKGSFGGGGIGGVGMQLQDVAVQLQMGTRLSTVFAQQGSQIASGFGAAGVAIGAVIAVAGALYTVGQKNKENFDALVKSSKDLSSSFDTLTAASDFQDIAGGASAAKDQIALLNAETERLSTVSGQAADVLGQMFGGDTSEEKSLKTDQQKGKLMMDRVELGKLAVESAREELNIANLRAKGLTDQAEEAQRMLDLTKKLAAIDKLPFTTKSRDDLKTIATSLSEATAEADKLKKEEKKEEVQKPTGADTNGDGFISKREQRIFDLAQKRGQRRADSIKGFSRKARGLSAFAGLAELEEMSAMQVYQGAESVGQRWRGIKSTSDPRSWSITPNLQSAFGGRAPDSSSDRIASEIRELKELMRERLTVD